MFIPHSKPFITPSDVEEVASQVNSKNVAAGETARLFRDELTHFTGAKSLYLTSSGSAALAVALTAAGVGIGDEVVLPTYVCYSVVEAVLSRGAKPVLCDIGEEWVMTPESVGKVITDKTKVIIIVHVFGICTDVTLYREFGVALIEDSCQSFAARVGNIQLGVNSDLSVYSFQATKCLTTGEGGAVACFNAGFEVRLKEAAKANAVMFPMSDLQASLGWGQLSRYEEMLERRSKIAEYYFNTLPSRVTERLRGAPSSMFFRFPLIVHRGFEEFNKLAGAKGISVRRGVDELLHRRYCIGAESFSTSEDLYRVTVSIPLYPGLTDAEVEFVAENISGLVNGN